jgi:hypothetical protein
MMDTVMAEVVAFLKFLIPIAVPALVAAFYDKWQAALKVLQGLPPYVTQMVVASVVYLSTKFGLSLPGPDPLLWDQSQLGETVAVVLAYVFKIGQNQKYFAKEAGMKLAPPKHDPGA